MPRSRSIFIQWERVLGRSPLALTCPARLMAPPNSSSFSVSVVLPASGCEMIAKVRRRSTSEASGGRADDSEETGISDTREPVAGKPGWIKGGSNIPQAKPGSTPVRVNENVYRGNPPHIDIAQRNANPA